MYRTQQRHLPTTDVKSAPTDGPGRRARQRAAPLWSRLALTTTEPVQPKLAVGPADDEYEREADAVAERVMRMPDPQGDVVRRAPLEEDEAAIRPKRLPGAAPPIQRLCPECEEELQRDGADNVRAKRESGETGGGARSLGAYVSTLNGKGRPLPDSERHYFEPRFGRDFSDVRLHTDERAAQAAGSINALAFTHGNNIVLGGGGQQTGSNGGRRLLAHELTHVIQQKGDGGATARRNPLPTVQRKAHPCESKLGTCEFYDCLSNMTAGDRASGYYWNYGRKYCHRFNNSSLASDPKAARWVDCVTLNLQRALLRSCVRHGDDLDKVKECGYATHARAYTDCGICELDKTFITQIQVMFVPDASDLWTSDGLKQVLESAGHCFMRPFFYQNIVDRFTSWGNLDEAALGQELARWAKSDPAAQYRHILGVIELLSNTADDDDVAYECMLSLSDADLDTLEGSSDGRRILFTLKHALSGGWVSDEEQAQIDRIGDRSRR